LKGAARDAYLQRQADINAAMEARQAVESLARTVMVLASRMTGVPGPDAVRAIMNTAGVDGAGHGLAVVRAAGHSVPALAAAWRAEAPVQRQASRGTSWESDPDHSPEVMEVIARGRSMEELARVRNAAAAAHQAAREQQQKQSSVLWYDRHGNPVLDNGVPSAPVQQSVTFREWREFPDHQPQQQPAPEQVAPAGQPSIWSER
jgi:hypothetical protein